AGDPGARGQSDARRSGWPSRGRSARLRGERAFTREGKIVMNRKRRASSDGFGRWRLAGLRPFLASVLSLFVLGGCVRTRIVERRQPSVMYEQFGVLARAHLVAPPGERMGGEVTVEHRAPGARLEVLIDVWNGHPGVYGVHLIQGSSCGDLLSRKAQPLSE